MKISYDPEVDALYIRLIILQAFVWVHIKFSTVKQDSSSIVVKVSEPSRGRFYLLYFAINPFCYRIGYSMF